MGMLQDKRVSLSLGGPGLLCIYILSSEPLDMLLVKNICFLPLVSEWLQKKAEKKREKSDSNSHLGDLGVRRVGPRKVQYKWSM